MRTSVNVIKCTDISRSVYVIHTFHLRSYAIFLFVQHHENRSLFAGLRWY